MEKVATFNWQDWIPKIEIAVRENEVLEIDLPQDEWIRLTKGGFANLKGQISRKAAGRLCLLSEGGRDYLLVAQSA